MIGRSEWFKRRKYGGWGVTPKTWQGGVYILLFLLPIIIFQALPFWNNQTRIIGTIAWVVIFLVDVIDIMAHLKKDEREKIHEAMAERNALWGIMAILVLGILYQVIQSAFEEKIIFDWWIFAALFIGLTIKSISNIYLDRKN